MPKDSERILWISLPADMRRRAFTLVELLIVIAIIGLLSTVAVDLGGVGGGASLAS